MNFGVHKLCFKHLKVTNVASVGIGRPTMLARNGTHARTHAIHWNNDIIDRQSRACGRVRAWFGDLWCR